MLSLLNKNIITQSSNCDVEQLAGTNQDNLEMFTPISKASGLNFSTCNESYLVDKTTHSISPLYIKNSKLVSSRPSPKLCDPAVMRVQSMTTQLGALLLAKLSPTEWSSYRENSGSVHIDPGSFLEDVGYLLMKLAQAFRDRHNAVKIMTEAIYVFVRLRMQLSTPQILIKCYNGYPVYNVMMDLLDEVKIFFTSWRVQSIDEFSAVLDKSSDVFKAFMKLQGTALYNKLSRLFLYIMSSSICKSLKMKFTENGFADLEVAIKKSPIKNAAHFGIELVDTFLFILKKGVQIFKTGDISCIFHSGDTYALLYDKYNTLKIQTTQLHNPELFGFNVSSYQADLDDTIEAFTNIKKHSLSASKFDKEVINKTLNELLFWRTQFITKKSSRQIRKSPFSILFFGESGVGKTYMKELMFKYYGKVMGLDTSSDFCFTRSPGSNFWDGFRSSMWGVVLDDIGFPHPNKCPTGDETYKDMIQIINNQPFCPDQASLDDKGRTPMMCKLLIATTNVKNLNAAQYFSHASAAQRRLPIIVTPKVKAEYATADGMLDRTKLPPPVPGHFDDYWTFDVDLVQASLIKSDDKYAKYIPVHKNIGMAELLIFLRKAILDHEAAQDKFMRAVDLMEEIDLCNLCLLPKLQFCKCQTPPSIEDLSDMKMQSLDVSPLGIAAVINSVINLVYFCALYSMYKKFTVTRDIFKSYIPNIFFPRPPVVNRDYFLAMGQRAHDRILGVNVAKAVLIAISTVVTFYSGFKLYKKLFHPEFAMDLQSEGFEPLPQRKERINPWTQEECPISTFDLTSPSTSVSGMSFSDFEQIIGRNCCSALINPGYGPGKGTKMFCLQGNMYLANNHAFPALNVGSTIQLIFGESKTGITQNLILALGETQLTRIPKWDLVILKLDNLPPKQGIYRYLPKNLGKLDTTGSYINRDVDGSIKTTVIDRAFYRDSIDIPQIKAKVPAYQCIIQKSTNDGDCGSLLLLNTPVGKIVAGMHILGGHGATMSIALSQAFFEKYVFAAKAYSVQSGVPLLSAPSAPRELGPLHSKSPFRFLPIGTATVYGSYLGFRPQPKSRVTHSIMAPFLSDKGYKIKCGKPTMNGWEPWYNSLEHMVQPITVWDPSILDVVTRTFKADILTRLSKEDYKMVHVLDDDTTLNGCDGVAYVDKINRKTSAGAPWRKTKRAFMNPIDVDDPHGRVQLTDEIFERIAHIKSKYLSGERAMPVFTAHLKDEATAFKKCASKKTRVFCGAPLDFSFVVRKYLLGTVRLIQNRREIFESAPGTVAQSREWHEMYKYITQFGTDRIIAGDYSKFDKKMSSALVVRAFGILRHICEVSGNYDDDDLKIIDGITNDIAYPLTDFNGDLVMFSGTNPSGHPLTVIINGLVNCLMMRYAYFCLNPSFESSSFIYNVALMTYGDDNICSVSKDAEWFNHTAIAKIFESYGIGYTMADKEAVSVPFINISQATFLKRSWRFDEDVGYFLAPLDHDSIERQLMVWVASKTISPQVQAVSIVSGAVREYFFYGRTIFEEKRAMFKLLLEDLNLVIFSCESTLPTWEQLYNEFVTNSYRLLDMEPESDDPGDNESDESETPNESVV